MPDKNKKKHTPRKYEDNMEWYNKGKYYDDDYDELKKLYPTMTEPVVIIGDNNNQTGDNRYNVRRYTDPYHAALGEKAFNKYYYSPRPQTFLGNLAKEHYRASDNAVKWIDRLSSVAQFHPVGGVILGGADLIYDIKDDRATKGDVVSDALGLVPGVKFVRKALPRPLLYKITDPVRTKLVARLRNPYLAQQLPDAINDSHLSDNEQDYKYGGIINRKLATLSKGTKYAFGGYINKIKGEEYGK